MLNFAWPWMLILLPLPLFLWAIAKFIRGDAAKNIPVILFPKLRQVQTLYTANKTYSVNFLNWRTVLVAIAWICLTIALMRPELVQDLAYAENTGYDLMLAVDLSRSMDTVDFKDRGTPISRIAATKKVVTNFVQQRHGDRIGLIVFGEQAYLTTPLTLDSKSVVQLLNNLMVGMAGEATSIGDAIGIAVKNLRKRPKASRVLILLTDGEDTASHIPPLEAAKIAAADNIKIYTIGVGFKLDEKLLQQIAKMTSASYFKVTSVDALEQVYDKIDKLEKSDAKQQVLLIKKPLYHLCLLIALLCFVILYIFNIRRYRLQYDVS